MEERISLKELGLFKQGELYENLPAAELVEHALARKEGRLAANGALLVRTGERTGRSPNDKFFVKRSPSADQIYWSDVNIGIDPETFDRLCMKVRAYLQNQDLYIFHGFVGADHEHHLPVHVVTPKAWNALFADTLFIRPTPEELESHPPEFTIIAAGDFFLDGEADGINSEAVVAVDLERQLAIVAGTGYAGEIKKSFFTIMNYLLPQKGVMTMHCSANEAPNESVALFFGLSGTGKTTLSADESRRLIGDDEHGWSDAGVFNFEGGCYAKCINLSHVAEPQIHKAIKFGSVLENVVIDPVSRKVDYDSDAITENTRATYPVEHIPHAKLSGRGGHPSDIFFLAADAFGVLPPISRLDTAHAMYHFLSGYTAKLAGTEAGVTSPTATFSACFGEPFMPLHPARYAELLGKRIEKHNVRVWLVNTGWSGGPYGVGQRMSIQYTRALLAAALGGKLDAVEYRLDPTFGVQVPTRCPLVPPEILDPRNTWIDKVAYDGKAKELAHLFVENFSKYADQASEEILAAAPVT